jgi:hypothetical protein
MEVPFRVRRSDDENLWSITCAVPPTSTAMQTPSESSTLSAAAIRRGVLRSAKATWLTSWA